MGHAGKKRLVSALTLALAAGVLMPAGSADAQWRGNDRWSHDRHRERDSVGTLFIDGKEFCLEGRRSIAYEICEAFRCAGYRASVHGGCVTVRYRGCSPRVSLNGCEYAIRVSRSYGCLRIRPYIPNRHRFDRPIYRGWHYERPSRRHWHRWKPRRYSPRCSVGGISIQF
ncbi:MAG: hypothetical protein ED559_08425 [Phycisphaera sp.]|nr:MAG: hypothetical protein ED559_08425 [Phycisphaera sp.]